MFNAGEISGKVALDPSDFNKPFAGVLEYARKGSSELREQLSQPFGPASAEAGKFSESLRSATLSGSLLGTMLGGAATAGIGLAVGALTSGIGAAADFGAAGIKAAAAWEQNAIAMEVMTGSADTAKALMKDLSSFANTTPFELDNITGAAKQLLAMGVESSNVVSSLRMIGDVSAGLNQPLGEMAYLYGQIRSQGRAMTQDLNQFAGRGVPIYRELASLLKTNESGVRELAEEGKIGFAEIAGAFERMTTGSGQFAGMTERQAKSMKGLWSTLTDAWTESQRQFGIGLTENKAFHEALVETTDLVGDLASGFRDVGTSVGTMAKMAIPAIREVSEYTRAMLAQIGFLDPHRAEGNPFNADQGKDLRNIPAESLKSMREIAAGFAAPLAQIDSQIQSKFGNLPVKLKVESAMMKASQDLADSTRQLMNEIDAPGPKDIDQLGEKFKAQLTNLAALQEALNRATIEYQEDGSTLLMDRVSFTEEIQRQLRAAAGKSLGPLKTIRDAINRPTGTEDDFFLPGPKAKPIAEPKASGLSDKESERLNDQWRQAEITALKSMGRIEQAEKLALDHWMADELKKAHSIEQRTALEVLYHAKVAELENQRKPRSLDDLNSWLQPLMRRSEEFKSELAKNELDSWLGPLMKRIDAEKKKSGNIDRLLSNADKFDQLGNRDRASAYRALAAIEARSANASRSEEPAKQTAAEVKEVKRILSSHTVQFDQLIREIQGKERTTEVYF